MKFSAWAISCCIAGFTTGAIASDTPNYPYQKPGLWQNDVVMAGQHVTNQSCIDAESEAKTSAFGNEAAKNHKCTNRQITHNPDGSWTSVSTCEFRPGVMTSSRADIGGDFNAKITMTMRSPPDSPPEMTMTSTWTGPCKAGQKGGDVIMSDGTKMNVLDGTMTRGGAPAH